MVKVAGVDHVCLGSDFDGMPALPVGIENVSKLPAITAALRARGMSPEDVEKILGGNVLRVLEANEALIRSSPRPVAVRNATGWARLHRRGSRTADEDEDGTSLEIHARDLIPQRIAARSPRYKASPRSSPPPCNPR